MDAAWVGPRTVSLHGPSRSIPLQSSKLGFTQSFHPCTLSSTKDSFGVRLGVAALTCCFASRVAHLKGRGRIAARSMAVSSETSLKTSGLPIRRAGKKTGVLLINIGTPASTSVDDVRDYLSRFLGDDRVIDIEPKWLKYIVLQVLLGIRPQVSAEAYKSIWDPKRGSPLQFHTEDLTEQLQHELGDDFVVRMSFQYSQPFTPDAVQAFAKDGVDDIVLLPMFPQYASGTVGTCLSSCYETAAKMYCVPRFSVVPPFYKDSSFLFAQKEIIANVIGPKGCNVDHMLFSFHGLPEAQCAEAHTGGTACGPDCRCGVNDHNRNCYFAQCHETARLLASGLGLAASQWSVAFQSRLTLRDTVQWIKPYTDEVFATLAESGVRRLAIAAPSFTIDCLETLEELSITGKEQFEAAGGEELVVIPCLNSSSDWVSGLAQLVKKQTVPIPTLTSPGLCPVSGKFGVWQQAVHGENLRAHAPMEPPQAVEAL